MHASRYVTCIFICPHEFAKTLGQPAELGSPGLYHTLSTISCHTHNRLTSTYRLSKAGIAILLWPRLRRRRRSQVGETKEGFIYPCLSDSFPFPLKFTFFYPTSLGFTNLLSLFNAPYSKYPKYGTKTNPNLYSTLVSLGQVR